MVLEPVNANPNTLEIPTLVVGQNALQTQIAHRTKLVPIKNAEIPVPGCVDVMQTVTYVVMYPTAQYATLATLEIRSEDVISHHLHPLLSVMSLQGIHVNRLHVDHTVVAKPTITWPFALVSPDILAHHPTVDQSAFLPLNVHWTRLVFNRNVWIHVQDPVLLPPNAEYLTTPRYAHVLRTKLEIHLLAVHPDLHNAKKFRRTLAYHLHAELTQSVRSLTGWPLAPVLQATSALHQAVDQSALCTKNVQTTLLACSKSVEIHAQAPVATTLTAEYSTTIHNAIVVKASVEIHSLVVSPFLQNQFSQFVKRPSIHVSHPPVEIMRNVKSEMVLDHALVFQNILVTLTLVVALSVCSIRIVPTTSSVSETNVLILVLASAVATHSVPP